MPGEDWLNSTGQIGFVMSQLIVWLVLNYLYMLWLVLKNAIIDIKL